MTTSTTPRQPVNCETNVVNQPSQEATFLATDRVDAATAYVAPDLGWADLAKCGLEIYDVSGDHIEIFKEPHVRMLGENLSKCLEQAHLAQLHQASSQFIKLSPPVFRCGLGKENQ
jgi:thioesterase domain-containing protein